MKTTTLMMRTDVTTIFRGGLLAAVSAIAIALGGCGSGSDSGTTAAALPIVEANLDTQVAQIGGATVAADYYADASGDWALDSMAHRFAATRIGMSKRAATELRNLPGMILNITVVPGKPIALLAMGEKGIGVVDITNPAAMVYRKAVNKNLIRGRSIEGVVAASLYAACRQCNVPRTLDEIANSSRVGRKEIGRTYRFMTRELKLKLMPTKPQDYVSRFCSELKLSGEVQSKAVEILKDAQDKELTSGRGPTGVSAAAIYIASILCNERRTQREVADVAGVTEVTIRNRYKELTEKLGIKVEL